MRGQRTFEAGDREITILLTNRAFASAEERLDKGIVGILQGFETGASGIREVAALLWAGMQAARRRGHHIEPRSGSRVTINDAYDIMDEIGLPRALTIVAETIAEAMAYESDPDPNA